jgi:hypothetical protein
VKPIRFFHKKRGEIIMPDTSEMAQEAVKLLARYVDTVKAYGGEDSNAAKKFIHDHEYNPTFLQLVAERNSLPQPEIGGSK